MKNLLETAMLLCFGISWPISAWKHFRAGTTEGMSLSFILLILLGYLSGIAAKLVGRSVNYVLIVYCFNLLAVSCDLLVYFRNRKRDSEKK